MHALLVVNPASGGRSGERKALHLARVLERRGHRVDVFVTERPGAARARAAEALAPVEVVIAAGGDGTFNEVLNGIEELDATTVAPFPIGTANMLARSLGLSKDPESFVRRLERGASRRIDLGVAEGRLFHSVLGVGFDAHVTELIAQRRRRRLGYWGYVVPILQALASYRPPRLWVRVDGAPGVACHFAIVGNHRNYGGILTLTPGAEIDSGMLDVCLIERARTLDLLRLAGPALGRGVTARPGVVMTRGREIVIESKDPAPIQVDGDYWARTPAKVCVSPAVLRVP